MVKKARARLFGSLGDELDGIQLRARCRFARGSNDAPVGFLVSSAEANDRRAASTAYDSDNFKYGITWLGGWARSVFRF